MITPKQLEAFIAKTFQSVWSIEILRFLSDNHEQSFRGDDLISTLRLSHAIVHPSVQDLMSAGLVVVDEKGAVAFDSANQAHLVRAAIDLYVRSPDKVRRLIITRHL
jgi:hypothetical protein